MLHLEEQDEFDALDEGLDHSLKVEQWDLDLEVSLDEQDQLLTSSRSKRRA